MLKYIGFAIWMLVGALTIEIIVYGFVDEPVNGKESHALVRYFDYGRSVESKVKRKVAASNSSADNLALAGWFKKATPASPEAPAGAFTSNVTIYGMSFSAHIGAQLVALAPEINVKLFGGPGAPLNHSYAYHRSHRPHDKNSVVILGILASSVPAMNSLTHMTTNFEVPGVHFFPRFLIDENGRLVEKHVQLESLDELRLALQDKARWDEIKLFLKNNDAFYDSLTFEENFSDHSVFARLLKRSLAQQSLKAGIDRYHNPEKFNNTDNLIDVARTLVSKFAAEVREDGAFPYVILFNDRGFGSHLYEMLEPVLFNDKIAHYSTHSRFPAAQLSNFISDGHFTPEVDTEIARAVLRGLTAIQE